MKAIKLICNPKSRFRLGFNDISHATDYIHSDTLFSAIINAHNLLYGQSETNNFIQLFKDRKIIISSAFYLIEILKENNLQKRIFFLPKICGKIQSNQEDEKKNYIAQKKRLKKIKFVSLDLFKEMLRNAYKNNDEIKFDIDLKDMPKIDEKFLITEQEDDIFYKDIKPYTLLEAPKVSLKMNADNELFYEADIKLNSGKNQSFEWRTHFYFLYESSLNSSEEKRFLASIKLLADEGIGGKRTTGAGWFEGIEFLNDFNWDLKGNYQTNLSLVSPLNDNLKNIAAYDSFVRGGSYVYFGKNTEEQKKNIRLIKEGAIFYNEINGDLIEVGSINGTKIYQNGINFGLSFGENLCN